MVFFWLVNLFTLEQIFAVVKIRHSSLILKEVLQNIRTPFRDE